MADENSNDRPINSDNTKKQVLLRLAPGLWSKIAAWAEDDFRSINGQIEFLLNEAVKKRYSLSDDKDQV